MGQVEGMELGPNLAEVELVRGHDSELVELKLIENLDGRGTILKQEKRY